MMEARGPRPALRRAPAARDRLCDAPEVAIVPCAEAARAYFERMLRLRAAAAAEPDKAPEYARQAIGVAWGLNNFLLGWAALAAGSACEFETYAGASEAERRLMLAKALGQGLPIMGAEAADELRLALEALNGGQVHPLLAPAQTGRKRKYPYLSAVAELQMLAWMRCEKGLGRKVRDAEEDLADAVGRSRETFRQWRRSLPKVFGEMLVRDVLDTAERYGRDRLAAHPFPPAYDPSDPNDKPMWLAARWVPPSKAALDRVVADWKRAIAEPKPG
jgi:hypothetical protein